jgi:hypothetical protein
VAEPPEMEPSGNPILRYLAILSAARDFGVTQESIEHVARRLDPFEVRPQQLADALADALREPRAAS